MQDLAVLTETRKPFLPYELLRLVRRHHLPAPVAKVILELAGIGPREA